MSGPLIISPHPNQTQNDPTYDGDSKHSIKLLSKGWRKGEHTLPLSSNIIYEKNLAIRLRDGVNLMVDILRPEGDTKVPAVLVWSSYGNTGRGKLTLSRAAFLNAGVLNSTLSGLEKFEGPDPAMWCPKGYAIVHVDARGTFDSEGIQHAVPGKEVVEDGYDVIEYLAEQPWCNGKVGACGSSQLAMAQWFMGEGRPPHLAALAPWEGASDNYRHIIFRGGIPDFDFSGAIFSMLTGRYGFKNVNKALVLEGQDGLFREEARHVAGSPSKINVPIYITASFGSVIHLLGSIQSFLKVGSEQKWLRMHAGQEWHDFYHNQESLLAFFDHFLRDIDNGFDKVTPRVRYQLPTFGSEASPIELPYRSAANFPPPESVLTSFYLDANNKLTREGTPRQAITESYDSSDSSSILSFSWSPDREVLIAGFPTIEFYASNDTRNDFDTFITLRVLNTDGQPATIHCWPLKDLQAAAKELGEKVPQTYDDVPPLNTAIYVGSNSQIRASHRAIRAPKEGDERDNLALEGYPFHPHEQIDYVEPNTIVRIETGLWPTAFTLQKGQTLRVDFTPVTQQLYDLPFMVGNPPRNANKGKQSFTFGGEYPARINIPIIS